MSAFNDYSNKAASFDTFNGTEMKCYVKVTIEYDEFGQSSKFELVQLANISAISGAEQTAVNPIPTIGSDKPIGVATGDSIVAGSITFEVINQSFSTEIKEILKKAGIRKAGIDFDDNNKVNYNYSEINSINDFPLVDLIIIGVKNNDANKKIEKEIQGVRFNKGQSGISVNQLGVKEQYSFIAISMTDFKPVKGAEVESIEAIKSLDIFE